jgi:hypothetical protein
VQPVAVALGSVDATAARSRGQGMSEGGGGKEGGGGGSASGLFGGGGRERGGKGGREGGREGWTGDVDPFLGSFPGSNIVCGGCRGEDEEHQGREERGVGEGGRGDAKISLIGDIHLENKWTQFIKNEISSVEQAGADVRDCSVQR